MRSISLAIMWVATLAVMVATMASCGALSAALLPATPVTKLTFSPNPMNFPDTPVGAASAAETVTITNSGNVRFGFGTPVVSGDFQIGTSSCFALDPGSSCTASLTFAPKTPGVQNGSLSILSSDGKGPFVLNLTGNGITPTVKVTFAPDPLTFPDTALGTASAAQTVTITNNGNVRFGFGTPVVSGDFQIGTSSCFALDPGGSCTASLTFAPKTLGVQNGSLTILSSDGKGPFVLHLTGKGILPKLTFAPDPMNFPDTPVGTASTAQTVTITNNGTAAFGFGTPILTGDFKLGTSSCFTLNPGSSCTASLTFEPKTLGVQNGSLSIFSSSGVGPLVLNLTGKGILPKLTFAPDPMNFPDTPVGTASAAQTVTITNSGTAAFGFGTPILVGDFKLGTSSCFTLNPGNSCTASLTFEPKTPGVQNGSLSIFSSSGAGPLVLNLTGKGITASKILQSLAVTPANPTIGVGLTQQFKATGTFSDGSTQDLTSSVTWASGTPATATISTTGLATALKAGTTTISATQGGISGSTTLTVNGPPVLQSLAVTPANPTISVGLTQQFKATGTFSDGTTQDLTSSVTWASGTTATATISTTGLATALKAGTTAISATSGAIVGSTTLTVTAGTKKLTVAPASLTFPEVPFGSTTASQDVTLTSTGSVAVIVFTNLISGADPSDFILTASTCTTIINPGTSCTYSFAFRPLAAGLRSATLSFTDDAPDSPQTVSLVGGDPAVTFAIGGTISGLTHAGLTLTNGADSVNAAANATSFTFGAKLATGTAYNVVVKTQPTTETCTVTNGTGSVGTTDVTNVQVVCAPNASPVWVWESGSKTVGATPSFGTLGVEAANNIPGPRDQSVSWTDSSGNLWLLGGRAIDSINATGAANDFWRYRPSTGQWTWIGGSNLDGAAGVYGTLGTAAPSNFPGARETAYSWTDNVGNFWLFGGLGFDANGTSQRLNDLWKYDLSSGEWTWVSGSDGNRFAGPTTLPFDAVYGTQGVPDANNRPGGRDFGVTWIDPSGNLWLFGGEGLAAPPPTGGTRSAGFLADLWRFDPSTSQWTWMNGSNVGANAGGAKGVYGTKGVAASTNAPGHRTQAVSWTDTAGNFWLFGGVGFDANGTSGVLNDLWKYDRTSNEWTWMSGSTTVNASAVFGTQGVPGSANVPDARFASIAWADKDNNLWLFGGGSGRGPTGTGNLNDLWQYNVTTGNWTWIGGSSGNDVSGVYGTLGVPASTNQPGSRANGISWIDPSGNLWHFGGIGFDSTGARNFLNDLWEYVR